MQNSRETRRTFRGQFAWLYKVLYHEKSTKPLAAVQAYLPKERVRFSVDRVPLKDWSPILRAIAGNRSLSRIYIYSRSRSKKIREKVNTEEKLQKFWRCGRKERVRPILYTNFLLRCLVDAIAVSIRDSSTVTSLTLDGIPLASKYLNILCCGLKDNEKLRNLSLTRCRVGDNGCSLLLACLRNVPNLRVLNLSSCRLTERSATFLSLFLKRKKADLLQNVWEKCSGRSNGDDFGSKIQGLHTLILNNNPKFGDNGIRQLTHSLKSDFWLKSLSLKHCGITKHGGEIIIRLLQSNTSITTIDLRENHLPIKMLQMIYKLLKRKRESTECAKLNKKLVLHWKCPQNEMFNGRSSRRSRRCSINKSNRRNTNSSHGHRKKIHSKSTVKEINETEAEVRLENKNDSRRSKLHNLESQLLNIIEFNCKLKEKLSDNKALLNAEALETLRMENELQNVSLRLNNLRNKVVTLNNVSKEDFNEIQELRHMFETMQDLQS